MLTTESDKVQPRIGLQVASDDGTAQQTNTDDFLTFQTAKVRLERIIKDFEIKEGIESKIRRDLRNIDIDVKKMKQENKLAKDQTIIPIRTIDTNISREKPPFIQYIKTPQRLMIFTAAEPPFDADCRDIEKEFTRVLTYSGWELPHIKVLDGAQVHGWDWVEVEYNTNYPAGVCIEHIGHDKLLFDLEDTINIQFAEVIIREYSVSKKQVKDFVSKYGFNAEQVKSLLDKMEGREEDKNRKIYKCYFKVSNIVMVGWFGLKDGLTDWLLAPKPHFIGIKNKVTKPVVQNVPQPDGTTIPQEVMQDVWEDAPLTQYPIFPYYYTITEAPRIRDRKGRVFLDEHKQNAQTAIATNFTNALNRASKVYGSPVAEDDTGTKLKSVDIEFPRDGIMSKPFDFWSFPAPDPQMLQALQFFDTANQEETGQIAYAVVNRQDSRKTKKEIESAEQQSAALTSTQVMLFSTYWRDLYTFVWSVVQSLALQNAIKFLQIVQPTIIPLPPGTKPTYINDISNIGLVYDLRPAGDIDFIQRQMTIAQMKQDWPVIQNVPVLNMVFLAELIRLEYPEKGEQYANLIMQSQNVKSISTEAVSVIQAAMSTPEFQKSSPQTQQAAQQCLQGLMQLAGINPQQMQEAQAKEQQQQKGKATNVQPT